jgi:hypothetical protein
MTSLSTPLSLSFSCKNLANLDALSKSDPSIWLYSVPTGATQATLIGKTETVKNDLNPTFATPLLVDYRFEEVQTLQIFIVDIDAPNATSLRAQDTIGSVTVTLGSIVSSVGGKLTLDIIQGTTKRGQVTVLAEEAGSLNAEFALQLSASSLEKKDFFGSSDPFFIIKKAREDGSFVPVHKSDVLKKNLNPVWNAFTITAAVLCAGDLDRALVIDVFDWDSNSAHDLIGSCQITARELVAGATFKLVNPAKKSKKGYTDSGTFIVRSAAMTTTYSFIDYLRSGFRINTVMAVDFTGSNGDPKFSTSLHYATPYQPNAYQSAIAAVGTVLLDYDTDKMIAAYGFGAKVAGKTNHCFPLTLNPAQVEVPGVPGVLAAYTNALLNVELHGPTNFAPLLQQAQAISAAQPGNYLVVVIYTDGVITDVDQTIEEIVKCSGKPISIIIVGVGNADFTQMNVLDADDGALKDRKGNRAKRDCVQFVAMNAFANKPIQELAAAVLKEVPGQFVSAMKTLGLKPNGVQ